MSDLTPTSLPPDSAGGQSIPSGRPTLQFEHIVELRTTGTRFGNKLLKLGWQLLHVTNEAKGQAGEPGMQPYVARYTVFVLGRPSWVEPFEEDNDE